MIPTTFQKYYRIIPKNIINSITTLVLINMILKNHYQVFLHIYITFSNRKEMLPQNKKEKEMQIEYNRVLVPY